MSATQHQLRSKGSASAAAAAVGGRKCLLLIALLLLVFLTLPHASQEFGFKFSEEDTDGQGGDKQVAHRRAVDKKFKFRKIARVYVDNENAASDDDDNGNDNDSEQDNGAAMRHARKAADNSRANEDDELEFERVRKAQSRQQKPTTAEKKARRVKKTRGDDDDDDDDDGDDDASDTDKSPTFWSSLFSGLFGGGDKKSSSDDEDEDNNKSASAEEDASKTNTIIDWLKWLGEKTGRSKPEPPPVTEATTAENLLAYFNRWPFNSLFNIGKPAKPIRMPRRRVESLEKDDSVEAEPMSQEHFESLLHTLPGFVVNASHVADIECRQQLQVFHRQLRGNKLWTLQMLDATGKITSGLLRGSINQFGDFEQCTQVKTLVKVTPSTTMRIRGKYCLAHIETQTSVPDLKLPVHLAHGRGLWNSHLGNPSQFVPRYAVANWGVCIPHLCSAEVVQQMLETNLGPYNTTGVEFHVEVDDDDCYMRQSRKFTKLIRKDEKFAATILGIAALGLLLLAGLLHEHWPKITAYVQEKWQARTAATTDADATEDGSTDPVVEQVEKEVDEPEVAEESSEPTGFKHLLQECLNSFSPTRTLAHLLSQERLDVQFPIFHVLKLGATLMLYICLKYLMIGHLPITNRDKLVNAVDQPFSILFRAPVIYADVLLLISGFLAAYQLSEEMEQKSYIQLLKRLAMKVARYLPTLYLVLFFQTYVLPHLGAGPLWSNLIGQNADLCEQQMWRNVFSVQNSIDFEETCSPMTIQLGLEMQLYLLGPLIVWLCYTDSDAAFFVYGGIQAMSVAARYSRTNREHLSVTVFHGMNVSKFYRTANLLYASPISRATPYLLGIGAGLLQRSQQGSLDIAPALVPIGWSVAVASVLWCFWSPSAGMRTDYMYTSGDAAAYAAWSPLILGLALCWFIFMWPQSDRPVFKLLTTSRPVLFLSRIALPMQLVMYVVVLHNTASVKETLRYHITELINVNEICTIVALATVLAFLIDVPAQNVRRLVINRIFSERVQQQDQEQEPASGAEQSEGEQSEERSTGERATCDTPEPAETVWASDPEEEEQKYLARRRSSTVAVEDAEQATVNAVKKVVEAEEADEEEEEDEEEEDIPEEEEVKKRPPTPPPRTAFTRRRRPLSEDE